MATNASSPFADFIADQLSALDGLRRTRFFGGTGLVLDGTQFGMLMGNTLYFVVDDTTRPAYEKLGSTCFAYDTAHKRVQVRKYHTVPADLLEDSAALTALAREALGVAKRAAAKKRTPVKRGKAAPGAR